jgi:hypothetical protein
MDQILLPHTVVVEIREWSMLGCSDWLRRLLGVDQRPMEP